VGPRAEGDVPDAGATAENGRILAGRPSRRKRARVTLANAAAFEFRATGR